MEKKSKYRIDKNALHMKNLGQHTLTESVIDSQSITTSWMGTFYHYTSPEGLSGILKNRHIYFTDCQFLNDFQERIQINDELSYFWSTNRNDYDRDFYNLLCSVRIDAYEDDDFSYTERSDVAVTCRYFVLSTSYEKDSLSLWKYYAKNGSYNGYNVGLYTSALVDIWIDRDVGVAIEDGHVLYTRKEKQNKVHDAVEELYAEWCKYKRSENLDNKIRREFKAWISFASIFFKSESYSSEKEYRFVAIAPKDKLMNLSYEYRGQSVLIYDFRIVNGVMTPYIKIPFCSWNIDECWAISNIGIGPSLHSDQMKIGIQQMIQSLDYKLCNYTIDKSNIPLRY
jgi:hypothetical protein